MKPPAMAAAVCALALLTFFQFPGHTWLQQDSQIYAPILEHLNDPMVLRNDILVVRPHVSFTLFDETALALHRLTGRGFGEVLAAEQLVTRAFGIWGIWLMATAAGLAAGHALLVAAVVSLGAMILGPQVLTLEYEPIPRGFAVPLEICAVGLAAHGRFLGAGLAGAVGFLLHPPSLYPFWGLSLLALPLGSLIPSRDRLKSRDRQGAVTYLACLAAAVAVLLAAAHWQTGEHEGQVFFSRLTPLQVKLQQMRAGYVWISIWGRALWPYYLATCAVLAGAYWHIRRRLTAELRFLLPGLAMVGLFSVPASWLLLERLGWSLTPQIQPMRALLFVVLGAQFAAAVAGIVDGLAGRPAASAAWFLAAYAAPLFPRIEVPPAGRVALWVLLALLTAAAVWLSRTPRRAAALALAALAPFWLVPSLGGIVNYPRLHTPELAALSAWARTATPRDAVFLFADAPRSLAPGVFRAEALRAVYVDWKGGGQVNYLKELGEQWWFRWQQTLGAGYHAEDLPRYAALGVEYVVLDPRHAPPGRLPAFANSAYLAYRIR